LTSRQDVDSAQPPKIARSCARRRVARPLHPAAALDNSLEGDRMRNPWKLTAIGMLLVAATAVVTGVVVASRTQPETRVTPAPAARASAPAAAPPRVVASTPAVPSATVVKACNEQAAAAHGTREKAAEIVKDGAIGAVLGAAVGAAGGTIADGGKGAGKGAAIGGLVGAGAGALYGVNENRKHDAGYREAYAACLRSRGYRA
jgi:hypothetical protein